MLSRIGEAHTKRQRNKQLCSKAAIGDEASVRELVKAGADPGYKVQRCLLQYDSQVSKCHASR